MNREQILDTFRHLAMSKGLYGRLLEAIDELTDDEREQYLSALEEMHFPGPLDLVLYIEGC